MQFIGIDVAKAQLEFAGRPSGETGTVVNDEDGIHELVTRCQHLAPTLLVLEATGGSEAAAVAAAGAPRPSGATSSSTSATSSVACARRMTISTPP